MADQKISQLTELAQGAIATADELAIVDTDAGSTKRITWSSFRTDIASYIASLAQTLTNKTIDGDNNTVSNIAVANTKLTAGTGLTLSTDTLNADSASDSAVGVVELATAAETTTGTDATRAVTPDGLAGSDFGIRYVQAVVFDFTTDVATGDGKFYTHIPAALDGMNLVEVHAEVITAGTTNTTDIQINNVTQGADMLSTVITIDSTETGSDSAATPAVIDTNNDDVAENDLLRIDVDAVSTTAPKGLIVTLGFRLP